MTAVAPRSLSQPKELIAPFALLLLAERPCHGYALVERLKSFGFDWGGPGPLYNHLRQLESAGLVERLRFHGISRLDDGTRDVEAPGSKFNLSDVAARLGLEQLPHLDEWCRARERLAARYFACLEGDDLLTAERLPPRDNPGHSWNMFTVLLPLDAMAITRQEFVKAMHAKGIGIGISYEAIHLTTHFRRKGLREGQFPVSERIARETVTLPLYPEMQDGDVERVCAMLAQVVRRR